MKYKRGDKVKIREDLKRGQYGRYGVNSLMLWMAGKEVVIKSKNEKLGRYLIKGDDKDYWFWTDDWTDEMFEEVQE